MTEFQESLSLILALVIELIRKSLPWIVVCLPLILLIGLSRIPKALRGLIISLSSISITLFVLELILRSGLMDSYEHWDPLWAQRMNVEINAVHEKQSAHNPFGFNDISRSTTKPPGIRTRVAVMGDSFVWGAGVPRDQIWSVKLEKALAELDPSIETLHWAKSGWSTVDQLSFLKSEGYKFSPDIIIVGFVINDPDLGDIKPKYLKWDRSRWCDPIRQVFPESFNFVSSLTNRAIYAQSDELGYVNWVNRLYSEENLLKYRSVLQDFESYSKAIGAKLLFVLTPNNYQPMYVALHAKLVPHLKGAGVEYLDLYEPIKRDLSRYPLSELKANRADGHPGPIVTTLYAKETLNHLMQSGFIQTNK